MIDRFSFVNKELLVPLFIAGLVLFIVYFFKEWLSKNRRYFVLNMFVTFVTIASLITLVLEPTIEEEIDNQQGLLLTLEYSDKQKDSLIALNKGIKVFNYDKRKSIRKELDSLSSVYVLGQGISPYDFSLLNDLEVDYIPMEIPAGINRFYYKNQINLGERVAVTGSYNTPLKGSYMVLEDSGGNGLDSIQFVGNDNSDFSLAAIPKVSGRYLYQLLLKDSTGVLVNKNSLPIEIKEKEQLRILILNTFPTFETKYLKNLLAEQGHQVIVRSQLTKGKFKFEYFNTKRTPVYQFTEEVLNQFDIVIADAESYYNLGLTIKNRFEKSIRETGLGVFIQPSEFLFTRNKSSYFKFKRDGIKTIKLQGSNNPLEKYPFDFDAQFLVQPVLKGSNKTLVAYKQMGLGRVSTSTILNSYQLVLNGEDEAYEKSWTQILDAISKRKNTMVAWEAASYFPRIDEPFHFNVYNNLEKFSIVNDNETEIPLVQKPMITNKYSGTVYPKKTGWNFLKIASDSTSRLAYYVFDDENWKALKTAETIAANQKQFNNSVNKNRTITYNRPISNLYSYLLFLAGIGWLWLSPKLIGNQ